MFSAAGAESARDALGSRPVVAVQHDDHRRRRLQPNRPRLRDAPTSVARGRRAGRTRRRHERRLGRGRGDAVPASGLQAIAPGGAAADVDVQTTFSLPDDGTRAPAYGAFPGVQARVQTDGSAYQVYDYVQPGGRVR